MLIINGNGVFGLRLFESEAKTPQDPAYAARMTDYLVTRGLESLGISPIHGGTTEQPLDFLASHQPSVVQLRAPIIPELA